MTPPLPTPDGKITSGRQFAENAANLLDSDVQRIVDIVVGDIQAKYAYKANNVANLEALRDEVLTRLMEVGILATFDPTPCFYGEPPELEILGRVEDRHGFDHEKKGYEVNKANARDEDYLGQKGKSGE